MTRTPLPNRRPCETVNAAWGVHEMTVTIGYYPHPEGIAPMDMLEPGEVFADLHKGGQMADTLDDACVLISIALQHGVTPAALAKSLGRTPNLQAEGDGPASPIGTILEAMA